MAACIILHVPATRRLECQQPRFTSRTRDTEANALSKPVATGKDELERQLRDHSDKASRFPQAYLHETRQVGTPTSRLPRVPFPHTAPPRTPLSAFRIPSFRFTVPPYRTPPHARRVPAASFNHPHGRSAYLRLSPPRRSCRYPQWGSVYRWTDHPTIRLSLILQWGIRDPIIPQWGIRLSPSGGSDYLPVGDPLPCRAYNHASPSTIRPHAQPMSNQSTRPERRRT